MTSSLSKRCERKLKKIYGRHISQNANTEPAQNAIIALRHIHRSKVKDIGKGKNKVEVKKLESLDQGLCPWRDKWQNDPNRFPPYLRDVECSCSDCQGLEKLTTKLECRKLTYKIPVLRVYNERRCKYRVEEEEVGYGCMCGARQANMPTSEDIMVKHHRSKDSDELNGKQEWPLWRQ